MNYIDIHPIYIGEPDSRTVTVSSTWIWPMSQLGETYPTEQYSSQVPTPGLSSIG